VGVPRRVVLREGETLIGRAPTCDIVIIAPGVSRQHAKLKLAGGLCVLADTGSRYGTELNGLPLLGETALKAGDVFRCGQVTLSIEQRVESNELLSEHHQLVEDSGTLVRKLDAGELDGAGGGRAQDPSRKDGAALPSSRERRAATDRRVANRAYVGPDRRKARDRRQPRLLRLLSEIGKTLVTVQPLPQILTRVVDLVFDVVPAERAFLLLRDAADQALTARVLRNRDGSAPQQTTLSRTIVNRVMRERVAMLAQDALYDSRLDAASSIQAMHVRSFMCAPLWNRNEVIGVLYVDSPRSKRFVADDLDVFAALANYAAVAIEQARMSEQLLQESKWRERLQRYHSPGVVNRILLGGSGVGSPLIAQERDVTVMFCDIVAFTALCEGMKPYQVAELLNHYFTRMAECLFEHEGTLDKFIGDAILAVFGAPFSQEDHADRAVQAALSMRRSLAEMNALQPERTFRMRIALNSGRALTGDIGSPRRREFTVLGDVVNIASRLESSVCKPDQIIVTRETIDRLTQPIPSTSLGRVSVRGRQAEVDIFEL
jgi:adenylate cyclase